MSSVQQKPKKLQADTSSSETQAKPHNTKAGGSHDHADDNEIYESTQLATQSNSSPEIHHDPPAAKAGGSSVDQDDAEESTQLASSLQSDSYPKTRIERPVDENDGLEPTQLASSLESSSSAAEIRGDHADKTGNQESTQLASSLQSISSSQRKEFKSHIKEARGNLSQGSRVSLQEASSVQTQLKYPVVKRDAKSPGEIFAALERASHLMPDARLVVRSLYSSRANETEHYSITYPPAKDAYQHMFGVVQSRKHPDFIFQTPLYLHIPSEAPRVLMEPKLDYRFIYDPTSDNCLLVNKSFGWETFLSMSTSPLKRIKILGSHTLHPGMWMISVKIQGSSQYHPALEILVAPRQFSITIYSENVSLRSKRAIEGDEGLAKRQRLNDGKSKIAVDSSDLIAQKNETSFLRNHTPRDNNNKAVSPILDLTDGEVAVVEVSTAGSANLEDNYQLQRIKNVVKLRATSVFTCQHSEVAGDVVAKVLRYSSDSIYSLDGISRSWKQEERALSKLHHKNIVSLEALDSRAFAFYLEHLPPSLNAMRESPLGLSDAKTILHDISSALAYLLQQEIIHYDIKPANIAYSPDRGAVLMDFGMADSIATIKKAHGGTPWFFPPDSLDGGHGIRGFPGDIWALGVTMLLVLGKIALPIPLESIYIHQLHDEKSRSFQRARDWMDSIAEVRRKLSLKNEVERLVFEMLHEEGTARIEAATIELALREKKQIA